MDIMCTEVIRVLLCFIWSHVLFNSFILLNFVWNDSIPFEELPRVAVIGVVWLVDLTEEGSWSLPIDPKHTCTYGHSSLSWSSSSFQSWSHVMCPVINICSDTQHQHLCEYCVSNCIFTPEYGLQNLTFQRTGIHRGVLKGEIGREVFWGNKTLIYITQIKFDQFQSIMLVSSEIFDVRPQNCVKYSRHCQFKKKSNWLFTRDTSNFIDYFNKRLKENHVISRLRLNIVHELQAWKCLSCWW